VVMGFIGSGNYATQVLIPAFRQTPARLKTVASALGVSGVHAAGKYQIEEAGTDARDVLRDEQINTVASAPRHDSHPRVVVDALCSDREHLEAVSEAHAGASRLLMVGFNRRFAPHVVKIKQLLGTVREPKAFVMTVNAGHIPREHWTQDPAVGGGRLIGE